MWLDILCDILCNLTVKNVKAIQFTVVDKYKNLLKLLQFSHIMGLNFDLQGRERTFVGLI